MAWDTDLDYKQPEIRRKDEKVKNGTVVMQTCVTNENYREYSFRVPIEGDVSIGQMSSDLFERSGNDHPTVLLLSGIAGILSVSNFMNKYSLHIMKPDSYEWYEIEPEIFRILNYHDSIARQE